MKASSGQDVPALLSEAHGREDVSSDRQYHIRKILQIIDRLNQNCLTILQFDRDMIRVVTYYVITVRYISFICLNVYDTTSINFLSFKRINRCEEILYRSF